MLDASVLIAHFDVEDRHHPQATALFVGWWDERLQASTVTIAEMLVRHVKVRLVEEGEAALRRLRVVEQPLDAGCAPRLAALRATTSLKLPDCCVLLAAQDCGADAIATFDDRLATAARDLGFAVAGA